MGQSPVSKAALGRIPDYLRYLKSIPPGSCEYISATVIAKALGFGEVQVRKDLSAISGEGRPKVGYAADKLIGDLESFMCGHRHRAVIVGAGKLGLALLDYGGFSDYGLEIVAAFDSDSSKLGLRNSGKQVYPADILEDFCMREDIRIGIITVPAQVAQQVCDRMLKTDITAIWSFAPIKLNVRPGILLQEENLALSLAYLDKQIDRLQA